MRKIISPKTKKIVSALHANLCHKNHEEGEECRYYIEDQEEDSWTLPDHIEWIDNAYALDSKMGGGGLSKMFSSFGKALNIIKTQIPDIEVKAMVGLILYKEAMNYIPLFKNSTNTIMDFDLDT